MACNKDCFNCPFPDCVNDEVDAYDVHVSNVLDKQLEEKVNPTDRNYKYRHSRKNKLAQKRYYSSEKGKIANQKNVKKYYKNHREERILYSKRYYEANKEKINERKRKAYYQKKTNKLDWGIYDDKGILTTSSLL